jgi:hypothetical protein
MKRREVKGGEEQGEEKEKEGGEGWRRRKEGKREVRRN